MPEEGSRDDGGDREAPRDETEAESSPGAGTQTGVGEDGSGDPGADADADSDTDAGVDSGAGAGAGVGDGDGVEASAGGGGPGPADVPPDVAKYDRFKKVDGAQYERVNDFLRERTYITAREWAIARLCADFRTETGVEMTKIGENLPRLVPFMTDTYTPQAVNQARASFEEKIRKAGATFLYGAMSDFLTADELDDVMYESTEVAKFLLEVEGIDLAVEEELAAEERISTVMREVREASDQLRHGGVECPHCGTEFDPESGGHERGESAESDD